MIFGFMLRTNAVEDDDLATAVDEGKANDCFTLDDRAGIDASAITKRK